jgi:hypothetical protein
VGFLRRLTGGRAQGPETEPELGPDLTLINEFHQRLAALSPSDWIGIFERVAASRASAKSDMSKWTHVAVKAMPRNRERRGQRDAVIKAVANSPQALFEPMQDSLREAGLDDYLGEHREDVTLATEWALVVTSALGGTAYELDGFAEFYAPFEPVVPLAAVVNASPSN